MTRASLLALLLLACSSTGARAGSLALLGTGGAVGSGGAFPPTGAGGNGAAATGGETAGGFATGGAIVTGGTGGSLPVAGTAGAPGGSTAAGGTLDQAGAGGLGTGGTPATGGAADTGGTGGGSAPTGPCVGLCTTAQPAELGDHMGAGCSEVVGPVAGWTCAAISGGSLAVNGAPDPACNVVQRPATLRNGGVCFELTGGASYAYVQAW